MNQPGFNGKFFLFHGSFDTCKIVKIPHSAPTSFEVHEAGSLDNPPQNSAEHLKSRVDLGYKFTKKRVPPWQLIHLLKISGWKMIFFLEIVPFQFFF